ERHGRTVIESPATASGGRRLRLLEDDVLGPLVVAQPLVDRGAEGARRGPLAELDFGDQLRLGEDCLARRLASGEGALLGAQGLEQAGEAVELVVRESRADAPRVPEVTLAALALVVAEEEGAEGVLAPPLS